jgi:hypothetical protein
MFFGKLVLILFKLRPIMHMPINISIGTCYKTRRRETL